MTHVDWFWVVVIAVVAFGFLDHWEWSSRWKYIEEEIEHAKREVLLELLDGDDIDIEALKAKERAYRTQQSRRAWDRIFGDDQAGGAGTLQ